jgi:hypothetical protein
MDNPSFIPPSEFDVVLNDIVDEDFKAIGDELGAHRLTPAAADGVLPASGILYGTNKRVFLPLTVRKKDTCVNVLFLLDTGSATTFLRTDTFRALGFAESIPKETNVHVHGVALPVSLSHGHFDTVDLLGQDFLSATRGKLVVDYGSLTVTVSGK